MKFISPELDDSRLELKTNFFLSQHMLRNVSYQTFPGNFNVNSVPSFKVNSLQKLKHYDWDNLIRITINM